LKGSAGTEILRINGGGVDWSWGDGKKWSWGLDGKEREVGLCLSVVLIQKKVKIWEGDWEKWEIKDWIN
jgi:hypothetical protein